MRVFNGVINTHVLVRWVRNACRDDRDERIIIGRFPWRVCVCTCVWGQGGRYVL